MSDILAQKQETTLSTSLGNIKVKVPSLTKRLELERKKAIYSGGFMVLSNIGADLTEMFAFLDIVMIECTQLKRKENDQSSWEYDTLADYEFDTLLDAYKKADEWLNSFRKTVDGK